MKLRLLFLITILALISCKTLNQSNETLKKEKAIPSLKYEVHSTQLVTKSDTVYVDEIRFYNPKSALDCMIMMYSNHGKFDSKYDGKYQDNIKQKVWKNLDLFGDKKQYSIIADGTETMTEYFASLIIFDENQRNCLSKTHPDREKIIVYFLQKMQNLKQHNRIYSKVKDD